MAEFLEHAAIESIVRQLLALPTPPTILILSFHKECKTPGGRYQQQGAWQRVEDETLRVCRRYNQSCVSYHRTLKKLLATGALNASMAVPSDCLHPSNGHPLVSNLSVWTFDLNQAAKTQKVHMTECLTDV